MKIYLVGGALRDQLLSLPITDKDWLVVGASVDEMLALGYKKVGRDFAVFLHPKTGEEYALARTERKTGKGYTGFSTDTNRRVTLEQDLARRDLTINAIAQDNNGRIIDPFGGQTDLKKRLLKHTSSAFVEDPLRVLRVARFAAKLAKFNFKVADETFVLIEKMVTSGELNDLVPQRVWLEIEKALAYEKPAIFWRILIDCGALKQLLPMLSINALNIALLDKITKDNAAQLPFLKWPLLKWPLLMALLPSDEVKQIQHCLPVPKKIAQLALLASTWRLFVQNINQKSIDDILNFLRRVDIYRRPERFQQLLWVWQQLFINTSLIEQWQKPLFAIDVSDCVDNIEFVLQEKRRAVISQSLSKKS